MSYSLTTNKSWSETRGDLGAMFAKWGVRDWAVSCPSQAYDSYRLSPAARAVTIRYTHPRQGDRELTYGKQARPVDNIRVLWLVLEAMRLNETRGIEDIVREAYLALPAPSRERDPYEVLGVRPGAPAEVIEASYRALAKRLHPDVGGSAEAMTALNAAWEAVR